MKYITIILVIHSILSNNNLKVIGVLSLPTSHYNVTYSNSSFSMIPFSYVKWIEQTGVKVIPIIYD